MFNNNNACCLTFFLLFLSQVQSSSYAMPVHQVAESGNTERLLALIKQNPEVINQQDDGGYTPLHLASKKGFEDMVRELLNCNVALDIPNECNSTPLHCAVINGHETITELLLKKGANVDALDIQRYTSLALAAVHGHESIVQLLLRYKATVDENSIACAKRNGFLAIEQILRNQKIGVIQSKEQNNDGDQKKMPHQQVDLKEAPQELPRHENTESVVQIQSDSIIDRALIAALSRMK